MHRHVEEIRRAPREPVYGGHSHGHTHAPSPDYAHAHSHARPPPPAHVQEYPRVVHHSAPPPPQYVKHVATPWCSPLKILLICLVVFLLVGAIIGVAVYFVLEKKPVEQTADPPTDCDKGYERVAYTSAGVTCADIDECDQYPLMCPGDSECRNLPGSYECLPCGPGLVGSPDGRSCYPGLSPPVGPPGPGPCDQAACYWKPYSECYPTGDPQGFQCLCRAGYRDRNGQCEATGPGSTLNPADPCSRPDICDRKPYSRCLTNAHDDGHTCYCRDGYTDVAGVCIPTTPSPVPSNPCLELGTCLSPNTICVLKAVTGEFDCICLPGFNKVDGYCTESTRCDFRQCLNGGICVIQNNLDECQCLLGYSGPNCEYVSACINTPCWNGVCREADSEDPLAFDCVCMEGWGGDRCADPASQCDLQPCFNGRCLTSYSGQFICECDPGWEGRRCNIDSDNCAAGHCHPDNSACIDQDQGYVCVCDAGWTGTHCDVSVDDCPGNLCDPIHGACLDGHQTYTCLCADGYILPYCELPDELPDA